MGFRFTLESANTIANLSFGQVLTCYRELLDSEDGYADMLGFLYQFDKNFFSSEEQVAREKAKRIRQTLEDEWSIFRNMQSLYKQSQNSVVSDKVSHEKVLNALLELSEIFSRCRVKSLLLPKMVNGERANRDRDYFAEDFYMLAEHTLERLLHLHESISCLILQPQERPQSLTVFNAFPHYDVALNQAGTWPAVMFWGDQDDFAFVPVGSEDELVNLFSILKYEKNPIREIRHYAQSKKSPSHYLFHLSDLHFGTKKADRNELRLKQLLKSQLSVLTDEDTVSFVITGDVVQSPNISNQKDFDSFAEFLEGRTGETPIRVLGNHDINTNGLAILGSNQRVTSLTSEYPRYEILEDPKVILLLFNSNISGPLGKGEIGQDQMAKMGNQLDNLQNLGDYTLVAVMHHHLRTLPKPGYYDRIWFERFIPSDFVEEFLTLDDAAIFEEWLRKRNVSIVLHGHKHIQYVKEYDGLWVISCGSSTGQITHKEKGKTYLSFNVISFSGDVVTCALHAEDLIGAGIKTESFTLKR